MQIAFHIDDDGAYSTSYPYPPLIAYGWYIDDIDFIEGIPDPWPPEDFEGGIDGWYADHGIWEVGEPTDGPSGAHTGQNCLGTVLGGESQR